MWNASRKFLRLPWELKRFVLRSVLILPMTYLELGLFGFKRLLASIQHLVPTGGRAPDRSPEEIRTYVHLFSAVARRCPLPLQCLGQSVALCWLLRLRGIDAEVHIGVRKRPGGLNAHAWVQYRDRVLNDSDNIDREYDQFDSQALNSKVQWV